MRKAVCFLLILATILSMNVSAITQENTRLSTMSDAECMAFLESNGINIPETYNDSMSWIPFIRAIIAKVEEDPTVQFVFGYSVASEFAYQIKSAVNMYYGFGNSSTYSLNSSNILQDNIQHGNWSSNYTQYNCYAYAIDYYEYGEQTTPGMIEWINNGNLQENFIYNWLANAYTVAGWVVDDLESLGYTITNFSGTLPATEVSDHTHLICVRIDTDGELYYGFRDFHLMKLEDDGYWYHKPGQTNPLRYKYTPSNDRIWVAEWYDGTEYVREEEWTYDSDIWFIEFSTPHNWTEYAYYAPGQHVMTCSVCGLETLGNCEAGAPNYLGLSSHQSACELCSGLFPAEACTREYVNGYDATLGDTHQEICTVCNHAYSAVESCTYIYTDNEDGTHTMECSGCGNSNDADCEYQYTYTGNSTSVHTHSIECTGCEYNTAENCTFSARYAHTTNGVNYHRYVCDGCGYTKSALGQCVYKNSDNCFLCGASRDAGMVASTQEPSTAE